MRHFQPRSGRNNKLFGREAMRRRLAKRAQGYMAASACGVEPLEDRTLLSAWLNGDAGWTYAEYLPPRHDLSVPGGYLSQATDARPQDIAMSYLTSHAHDLGVTAGDLADVIITDQYSDQDTGVTHIYLRQSFAGLEISNAEMNVNVLADGRVLSIGGGFVGDLDRLSAPQFNDGTPPGSALAAIQHAAGTLGLTQNLAPTSLVSTFDDAARTTVLSDADLSLDPIPARLHYVATPNGLDLAWDFVLRTPDGAHWYDVSVDESTAQVVAINDWANPATYNVFALPTEAPNDGPGGVGTRTIVTDPADLQASPYGWQDTNGVAGAEYTDTRGNNVSAQDDVDANNTGGFRPDGTASLAFNFPLDLTGAPSTYQSAAITNLFYWNNLCHDLHYRYGFTEVAGNFQVTNYTGQGLGNDAVQADAQDGSGTNNANFATPPDGQAPRMQMYIFNYTSPYRDGDLDAEVMVHEYGHGVSNRLTGGPANANALSATQSGGMGEGWGDWWGLMFTQKPADTKTATYPVGTYVLGQTTSGAGIRRYPYAFDMAKDPLTINYYNTDSSKEVHNTGEIWCSTLWDLNWLLIDKYGYSANIASGYTGAGSAGNILALKIVEDALKLQPANPSFKEARDAILQADQVLTGGVNAYEIWTAFARRGMGYSFVDSSSSATSVTVATDLPPAMLNARVSSQSPSGVSTSPVSSLDLTFSRAMSPTSFDIASDVNSFTGPGGVNLKPAITGYAWTNSNQTLHLTFSAQAINGLYSLSVGPQILAASDGKAMDQNGNGTVGEAGDVYVAQFRYDAIVGAVVSTTPANGSLVTLPLTSIDVTFNEAFATGSLSASDLTVSQGTVTGVSVVNPTTARFTLSGLTTEGTLTLSIAAGAVTDADGNPMAAYSGSLYLDTGTVAVTVPLTSVAPAGGMIYTGSMTGTIGAAVDTDSFTLTLAAGQILSVLITPASSLRATIQVLGPGGVVLGSATAATAGKVATLQGVPAAISGTYTLIVGNADSTTGAYTLAVTTNAALENETYGGSTNDTRATAQNIDASFIPLVNGTTRGAVLGQLPGTSGSIFTSEGFESGSLGSAWSTYMSTAYGRILVTSAQGAAAGSYALIMDNNDSSYGYNLNEAVWTVNLSGITSPTLTFSTISFADETDILPTDFTGHYNADGVAISANGTNWHTIWTNSSPTSWTPVTVDLAAAATAAGITLGANFKIKFQQYDNYPVTTDGRGYDAIAITTPAPAEDWYAMGLTAGQPTTVAATTLGSGSATISLYDAAGTLLASGLTGATNLSSQINGYKAIASGTYYVRVTGSDAPYSLVTLRGADFDTEPNSTLATRQTLAGNTTAVLGYAAGGVSSALSTDFTSGANGFTIDNTGGGLWHLSTGHGAQTGHSASQSFYYGQGETATGGGTYSTGARNTGTITSPSFTIPAGSSMSVAFNYILKTEGSTSYDLARLQIKAGAGVWTTLASYNGVAESTTWVAATPVSLASYAGQTVQLRFFFDTLDAGGNSYEGWYVDDVVVAPTGTSGDDDYYSIQATAGQTINARTMLPPDGSGASVNTLDPALDLYSPSGVNVATNDNGAGDGRNAAISYVASAAGTYTIRVRSAAASTGKGEYILSFGAPLVVSIPANASEGDSATTGTVSLAGPAAGDVVVSLTSGNPARLTVPATCTIAAGQASASFPITIVDNSLLDGSEQVTLTCGASGYISGTGTITIHDNETATLTISLPATTSEAGGTLVGTLTASAAPTRDTIVSLTSSNPARATVPATVTLKAGQTTASFNLSVINNTAIDGTQSVIVTAAVESWTSGVASIDVQDNDAFLTVTMPTSGWEGQTLSGTVQVGGTLTSNLTVTLGSSDTTEATVPTTVTILAGQTSAAFTLTLVTDMLLDGTQTATVTATAAGLTSGNASVVVRDADLDHLTFDTVSSPNTDAVPFAVTVRAFNNAGEVIPVYASTVTLSATGESGSIAMTPTSATFAAGVWTGNVTINAVDSAVILIVAAPGGMVGGSNMFTVQAGTVASFQWGTISSPQSPNLPFAAMLTAKDVNGFTATGFNGIVTLGGLTGSGTPVPATPISATFVNGIWSGSLAVTQAIPGMHLHVDDGAGHTGDSNPFDTTSTTATPATPVLASVSDSGVFNTDKITNLNNATPGKALQFTIAGTTPGATVALYVNNKIVGSALTTDTATTIFTDGATVLADGSVSVVARQTISGIPSGDSAALMITVDTIAPTSPVASDLQAASDSGASNTDNITNIAAPALTIAASPYFRFYRNGVQLGGDYQAGSTYTVSSQADGTYSYAVVAVDAAGNASALSASLSVTIDTVAPAAPIAPDLQTASDSGISNTDNVTNSTTPGFGVVASEAGVLHLQADGSVPVTTTLTVSSAGVYTLSASAGGSGGFLSAQSVATGSAPCDIALADFNLDGKPDLAVGNSGSLFLSVLLGKGDGTFTTGTNVLPPTTAYVYRVVTADFNKDGKPDIAFGTAYSGVYNTCVALGKGDGTFQAAVTIGSGFSVAAADIDKDGNPDLAIAGGMNIHTVTVYRGNGNGTFQAGAVTTTLGTAAFSPVFGDINVDGKLDLAYIDSVGVVYNVYTALGNGNGTFQASVGLPFGGDNVNGTALADVNHDGKLDVIAGDNTMKRVYIALGNGDGTFKSNTTLTLAGGSSVAVADLDLDGNPDLVTSDYVDASGTAVCIAYGNGDGTFRVGPVLTAIAHPIANAVADLNGDGLPDILTANYATAALALSVFLAAPSAKLSDGTHNFTAWAEDVAGNISPVSSSLAVTIDTVAPNTPVAPDLQATSDSGISSTDNITNIKTPTLDVAATPYFRVYNGTTLVGASYNSGTTFTAPTLADGTYSLTLRAVDAAGNESPASGALSLTIDTVAWQQTAAPAGVLDASFNSTGYNVTTRNGQDFSNAVAVAPDGKIVAVGESNRFETPSRAALARYNTDGTLDTTFGAGGRVFSAFLTDSNTAQGVAIQPDGKIVIVGESVGSGQGHALIARYNVDGSLDTSFAGTGYIVGSPVVDGYYLSGVAVLADGKLVVAGSGYAGSRCFYAARYNANGTLDSSFGTNGRAYIDMTATTGVEWLSSMQVMADGRIVLAGEVENVAGRFDVGAARLTPGGMLDTTFNAAGKSTASVGLLNIYTYNGLAIDTGGSVFVGGQVIWTGGYASAFLLAFGADGKVNTSFGGQGNGYVTTDFGLTRANSSVHGIHLQSSGGILIDGYASGQLGMARYKGDGTLDATFGTGGVVACPIYGFEAGGSAVQTDGRLVVAGSAQVAETYDPDLLTARFNVGQPLPISAPALDSASDTGISSTDGITNDNTPTFNLSVSAGYYTRVYRDGAQVSTDYFAGTAFTAPAQSDGTASWTFCIVDAAGNVSPISSATSVSIDTVAPGTPAAPDLDASTDTGTSSTDNITDATILKFNFSASPYFRLFRDGTRISGDFQTGSTYTTATQPLGTFNYAIAAVDAAGNQSTLSSSLPVTITDFIPPAPSLSAGSDTGISTTDAITRFNNSSPASTLTFTVGPTMVGATVNLYADGILIGSTTATGTTTTITSNGTKVLADGVHSIVWRQQASSQAESADSHVLLVTIDTVAPAAPVAPDLDASTDTGSSSTDNITDATVLKFNVSASPYFRMFRDGIKISGDYEAGSTYATATQPLGTFNYATGAVDAAGNQSVLSPALPVTITVFLTTIFVDVNSPGPMRDGKSWATAYLDLQQALAAAVSGNSIKVADGTYKPTASIDRTISFQLTSGVATYGGYAGYGATNPDARDVVAYPSILSGDIGTSGNNTDNSYHVVVGSGMNSTAILNGFTITGGNASRSTSPTNSGGGMYNSSGSPTLANCMFNGNTANYGGGMYNDSSSSPTLTNCTFSGNSGYSGGGGMYNNSSSSPTLTNCTFSGNQAWSGGGIYDNFSSPTLTNCILWANGLPSNAQIHQFGGTLTVTFSIQSNDGGYTGIGNIYANPLFVRFPWTGPDGVFGTADDDYGDLRLGAGSPAADNGSNAAVPTGIITDLAGNPRIQNGTIDMGAYEGAVVITPKTIYVDRVAVGANAGTSWTNAFTSLQSALKAATDGDTIRIADGIYQPTSTTDRGFSFALRNAVAIYGGYAGYGAPNSNARDRVAYPTIVSGDIGTTNDASDNSYHVLTASGLGGATVLDGITVTGGNANGSGSNQSTGGGLFASGSSPTLTNCTFSGNSATGTSGAGGGMYNDASSPTLTNCVFNANWAKTSGGGMYNTDVASPTLFNCSFNGNFGGGMHNDYSNPALTNCTFSGNTAYQGGGMFNGVSSSPTLTNCTFSGNSATSSAGGMYNYSGSHPNLINCIFWGNGNSPVANDASSTAVITYSDVQGGYSGAGNINADPLLVRNPSAGPDGTWGTSDDDYGNLSLQPTSPCIDAGSNAAIPAGITTDLLGNTRIIDYPGVRDPGAIVDMGAYERPLPIGVTLGTDTAINEASGISRSASFSDTDVTDTTFTATVNYGDGGGTVPLALNTDRTFSLNHTYADNGLYTVTVTISGTNNGSTTGSFKVTVNNVAPTVLLPAPAPVPSGTPLIAAGSFTDPGTLDTWTATVDYGDGSGAQSLMLKADKTFNLSHLYAAPGQYSVTVKVTDKDGGIGFANMSVAIVDTTPPAVQSTIINDGSAQRSMVNSVTLNFSEDLAGLSASALVLKTAAGAPVPCTLLVTPISARTFKVTFSGAGIVGGSLGDGRYVLTVLAGQVKDVAGNNMAVDYAQSFWRLFGDVRGTCLVTSTDYATIRQALLQPSTFLWYYDCSNSGKVTTADLLLVRDNVGKMI